MKSLRAPRASRCLRRVVLCYNAAIAAIAAIAACELHSLDPELRREDPIEHRRRM